MVETRPYSELLWRLFILHQLLGCTFFARAFSAIPLNAKGDAFPSMNPFFGSLVDEPTLVYQEKPRTIKRPHAKRKLRSSSSGNTATILVEAPLTRERLKRRASSENISKTSIPKGISHQPKKGRRKKSESYTSMTQQARMFDVEEPPTEINLTRLENMEKPTLRSATSDSESSKQMALAEQAPKQQEEASLGARKDLRPASERRRVAGWMNNMEKRKYYPKALLTVDQEYEFGMKVQFMVRCEEVHRGLASVLDRVPTFIEWAAACGFTEPTSGSFSENPYDYLRPAGFEEMFEETDPDFFVGNGLAHEAGPGRGCARKQAPPPLRIGDWYDDSEYKAQLRAYKEDKSLPKPVRGEKTPLNRGDVRRFVELLNAGRAAKQRMIESNMRLVVSIAGKYARAGVGLLDLIQEGSIGLHRAARKYEPRKGFKFSTYASWWIQQAVFKSIAYESRSIRLPVHIHNLLNKVRKLRRNLAAELRRKPTSEEMATRLGLPIKKYNYLVYLMSQTTSLDSPAYAQNPKDFCFESSDLVADTVRTYSPEDARTAEQQVDQSLFLKDLNEILQTLDEDERIVINLRYGLRDGLCRSVTSIAEVMNKSKTWVRSQECRGLRKLRRPWYEQKLRQYEEALEAS